MFRFSRSKSGCVIHRQEMGNSLTRFIDYLFGQLTFHGRNRLDVADLPDDLRRDIGLHPHRAEETFEERWQAELRKMQR